jgi:hypothetical protein
MVDMRDREVEVREMLQKGLPEGLKFDITYDRKGRMQIVVSTGIVAQSTLSLDDAAAWQPRLPGF